MSSAADKALGSAIERIAHEFKEELENAAYQANHESFCKGLHSSSEIHDGIMATREEFRAMLKRWLDVDADADADALRAETRGLLFRMRRANGNDGDTGCEA